MFTGSGDDQWVSTERGLEDVVKEKGICYSSPSTAKRESPSSVSTARKVFKG